MVREGFILGDGNDEKPSLTLPKTLGRGCKEEQILLTTNIKGERL